MSDSLIPPSALIPNLYGNHSRRLTVLSETNRQIDTYTEEMPNPQVKTKISLHWDNNKNALNS